MAFFLTILKLFYNGKRQRLAERPANLWFFVSNFFKG